jgi:hypothetical protein
MAGAQQFVEVPKHVTGATSKTSSADSNHGQCEQDTIATVG